VRDERLYRLVVRAAFGQRRKMLRNALATLAEARPDGGRLETVLAAAGVDPTARAETLDLVAFARIADALAAPS
jgi:16S rRNA (adenine1518-N6/adenine1519-N6)-dimethyltransferase